MGERGTLVLMVGLPRSGKSTEAGKQIANGWIVVCPDEIRKSLGCFPFDPKREPQVWETAKVMANALIGSGHNKVIIDATNVTHERRKVWIDLAKSWDFDYYFCYLATPADECKRRARADDQTYLIPVIDRMAASLDIDGWLDTGPFIDFPAISPA